MKRKEIMSPLSRKGFLTLLCAMALLAPLFLSTSPSIQAAQSQQINLDQSWGYSDTFLHVHGSYFSPNSNIVINWSSLSYWSLPTRSDASGSFDLSFFVPAGVTAGNYIISASDQLGNAASTPFTLRSVYSTAGSFGIRTSTQLVQWIYGNNGFYLDDWQFYNTAYGGWYAVLNHQFEQFHVYGAYITRFTYNGVTYVYDLAGGKFNSYPSPLSERVISFSIKDVNHIQGVIQVYDPTGVTLLFTATMDVYTPAADNYYIVSFTITASSKLNDFSFYAEQNLDVWTATPNWASYNNQGDVVYQYYGPDGNNLQIPQQYSAYAGFASTTLASSRHDAAIDYTDVQNVVTNLVGYDFNYKNRDQANGEVVGNCGIGLQWNLGTLNTNSQITIPISYAESDDTFNQLNANIAEGKMLAYQIQSKTPFLTFASNQGPGSAIMQISGQNFMPNAQISIKFAGISVGNFLTDAAGTFQGNFMVPTSVTGTYSVTATDQYGLTASAPFSVVELTLSWLLNSLNQYRASITTLLTDPNGNLCTLINTNDGNIIAKLSDIKANLTNLVTNSNGQVLAQIDTAVGNLTANLNQINATIVGIVRDTNNNLNAKIDTAIGTITTKLDQINATVTGVVTNSNGTLSALINTSIGNVLIKLSDVNASLTNLVTNSNGQVLAQIDTALGNLTANLNQINATLVGIVRDTNNNLNAKIDTAVGTITTKLDTLNATLIAVNGSVATISTKIGTIITNLTSINAQLTLGNGNLATIKTDVGTIKGNVISLGNGTIAIETKLGIIKTSTKLNDMNVPLQAVVLVEIAAISASFLTTFMLRKGLPNPFSDFKQHTKAMLHRSRYQKSHRNKPTGQ